MSADTSTPLRRAVLFARTARYLRPEQVVHRARLRAQKAALARFPDAFATRWRRPLPAHPGWPTAFEALDGRQAAVQAATGDASAAEAMAAGRFRFLGEERELGDPADWEQAGADQLWRYHLHYFEWAWSLAAHPDRDWARAEFGRLWRSWRRGTTFGRWDAWSPYVVSLRAWALCGFYEPLVHGTAVEADYLDDLALHAGFVRANLELDVGGNHLVKNLKALAGLGVFLADHGLTDLATRHLVRQLRVQVLADGGHYERSPSYHAQVLGDLIDIAGLLGAAGRTVPSELTEAIAAMRSWLGAMLLPDGDVPMFNDCTLVGLDRLALLEPAAPRPPEERLTVLQPSGYVVVRTGAGRIHMVADVGPPCPLDLPAHAHADCLSFHLSVDGRRVVVNSGTSTYEAGERRDYERSTAAHSTVEIDGQDQTEVWGAFRAARRAGARLERADDSRDAVVVTASHDGYERLPGSPHHRRTWTVSDEGLEIADDVQGQGEHRSVAPLVLARAIEVEPLGGDRFRAGQVKISLSGGRAALRAVNIAESFGDVEVAGRLELSASGPLPQRLASSILVSAWSHGHHPEGPLDPALHRPLQPHGARR